MNQVDSAHVQAALIAQSGALSALFATHPDPAALETAYMDQIAKLAEALKASGAPREFWTVMEMQAQELASRLHTGPV
jgi:hypothetical protein